MISTRKQLFTLYVERSSQQWVVRDAEGNFWIVPCVENAWDNRKPYHLAEGADLAPVPQHYKYALGLPA